VEQELEAITRSLKLVQRDRASLARRKTREELKGVGQLGAEALVENCGLCDLLASHARRRSF
jgi:hypothetical protein